MPPRSSQLLGTAHPLAGGPRHGAEFCVVADDGAKAPEPSSERHTCERSTEKEQQCARPELRAEVQPGCAAELKLVLRQYSGEGEWPEGPQVPLEDPNKGVRLSREQRGGAAVMFLAVTEGDSQEPRLGLDSPFYIPDLRGYAAFLCLYPVI